MEQVTGLLQERRSKPRLVCTYPAAVRGLRSTWGKKWEEAVLYDLSRSGLYLRLKRRIEPNDRLSVIVRFSFSPLADTSPLLLAVRGTVVRTEPCPDGTFGAGIRLDRYRFVSSPEK